MTEQTVGQLRAELARAQEELTALDNTIDQLLERLSAAEVELTDTGAARDALECKRNDTKLGENICLDKMQEQGAKLSQTRTELMQVRKLWLNPAETAELRQQLAQAQRQLTTTVQRCAYCGYRATGADAFNMVARHIKYCPSHPLARALAELAQARRELDYWHRQHGILAEKQATLAAAKAALAGCGIGGIYDEFNGLADAIQQMAEYIGDPERCMRQEAERRNAQLKKQLADARRVAGLWFHKAQEVELAAHTERALRREAEERTKEDANYLQWLHRILREGGYIFSANEDGIPVLSLNPILKMKREKAEAEQRATRAEALAQLVNEETAALLERLARYAQATHADITSPLLRTYSWCNKDAEAARNLAAQIREALVEVNGGD